MATGDTPKLTDAVHTQHFTEPPPRFSEASLVKRLEELGSGRPSTYASTLSTLIDRDYVKLEQKRFIPEDKGRLVTVFLEKFFARYVEYDFTAALEEKLDLVSDGKLAWKDFLREFWTEFSAAIGATSELRVSNVIDAINDVLGHHLFPPRNDAEGNPVDPRQCPTCGTGQLSLKLGRYGSFVGCSNYPECKYTRQLAAGTGDAEATAGDGGVVGGPRTLGKDPESGLDVTVRDGRFGAYVQLGEGEKPKRQSLPKGMTRDAVDLDTALVLLSLPREVARHPESGEPILAGIGRFGPYVQHGKTYANIGKDDDVLSIGANRAIDLIVTKESGGGFRRGGATAGRVVGDHPDGGAVTVRDGKYGPYVNHGSVNANLPKGTAPDTVTLDQALALIKARIEAGGGKAKPARRGAAKASASKASASKASPSKAGKAKTTKTKASKPKAAKAGGGRSSPPSAE
jgi:DNA topoisomerase-1